MAMKAYRFIILLFLAVLSLWRCTPSFLYVSDPTVYVREELPPQETTSRLTVFPFESPSYYPEIGMYAAKLFFQQLLEKKEFEVSFSQDTDWCEKGRSWVGKTELAVEEGRRRGSDYILIGSVDQYMVGYITSSRVMVTARLIEVRTGEPIYFATICGSGKPGKTFLVLDLKSGENTPSATSVLYAVVNHIVKDCFDRKKGYLGPLNIIL